MPRPLTVEQLAAVRMAAQALDGRTRTPAAAARASAGLQAQDLAASRLAARARTTGLRESHVVAACNTDRTLVRTWLMRGTLHAVPAADVRWLVALLGPGMVRSDRRRREALGLSDDVCARVLAALPEVLRGTSLTRAEVVAALNDRGVAVASKGQAPAHALGFAAGSGLICRAGDRSDGEPTYALLDEWIPTGRAARPDDAVTLAERYLAAFGPAEGGDFAVWSGLPAGVARTALDAAAQSSVTVQGRTLLTGSDDLVEHDGVRLLPAFDTAVLGHQDRSPLGDRVVRDAVFPGGGWIHPSVLRAGRLVGRWRLRRTKDELVVAVELTGSTDTTGLDEEATDVGRFLGAPARLEVSVRSA